MMGGMGLVEPIHHVHTPRAGRASIQPDQGPLIGRARFLSWAGWLIFPVLCQAQVDYVAGFSLEKERFLLGEPAFMNFTIRNAGRRAFAFSYRFPSRVLNRELAQEPRFRVTDEKGRDLPDPAPQPCGGAKGSVVYGSVTLAPGQSHSERWLLNQWARFSTPGRYRVRAERRLPLFGVEPATGKFSERAVAYALALDELAFTTEPSTESELEAVLEPYVKTLDQSKPPDPDEAVLVVTTLPQPFLLSKLEALAAAPASERRWDRRQALEGLARLGTPAAWEAILTIARGGAPPLDAPRRGAGNREDDSLRAYAVLLLGEEANAAFLPPLIGMVSSTHEPLRGEVLRALGFFHNPHANQVLFEKLHSANAAERMNAILGLKNLGSRDAIPALLAMLNDLEPEVRQVANFALQSLTGQKIQLPARASLAESARAGQQWHAWWREKGGSFVPIRQPACHDW